MSTEGSVTRPRRLLRQRVVAAALIAQTGLGSGCGYTSKYIAPVDGRARPVWKENRVAMEVAGPLPSECRRAVGQLTSGRPPRAGELAARYDGGGYWVPRYYGPAIMVVSPGFAPQLSIHPLFLPHPIVGRGLFHAATAPHVSSSAPVIGGGRGDDNALGKAAVALAVLALLVLPAVDVGLALSTPENAGASVREIARANAFNDLARQSGSPCAYPAEPSAVPGGAP